MHGSRRDPHGPAPQFISQALRRYAYFDMGLPIGEGQTISSPFIVAYMSEQLQPQTDGQGLEIGTGSGYQAAVLSGLVAESIGSRSSSPSAGRAAKTLQRLGYQNVTTKSADGIKAGRNTRRSDKIIVHLFAAERSPAACPTAAGGRSLGGATRAALPADPVPVHESRGRAPVRAVAGERSSVPMMGQAEAERVVPDGAKRAHAGERRIRPDFR